MSDNESRGSKSSDGAVFNGKGGDGGDNICRDFLRNVCRRGSRCKYRHPEASEVEEMGKTASYVFCHDYQNKECRRPSCKFLHCTRQEEDYYRKSGKLPQHLMMAIEMGKGVPANSNLSSGEIPICKDYLKGDCRRGGRCKFRHVSYPEYQDETGLGPAHGRRDRFDRFDGYEPEPKRRAFDEHYASLDRQTAGGHGDPGQLYSSVSVPLTPYNVDYHMVDEEKVMLRRKVDELKKQVADLTATNEFLLDQNAQLRISKQSTTVSPVTQTLNPHTITPATASIPPISQQLTMNNSDLTVAAAAAQTTLTPQRLATELAATTPQTMAPIVPVTLAQGIAPVSIAPVAVSIAQALPAVSLSQSLAQSIITMSSTSTPLVSYPIMTQSMRPVIPHSLGR